MTWYRRTSSNSTFKPAFHKPARRFLWRSEARCSFVFCKIEWDITGIKGYLRLIWAGIQRSRSGRRHSQHPQEHSPDFTSDRRIHDALYSEDLSSLVRR
jgi:hypothetical protein